MQRKLQRLVQTTICSLILLGYSLCSSAQGLSFDWVTQLGDSSMTSNPNVDAIYAVEADDAGNVFITGSFVDTVDFDSGPGIAELSTAKPHRGEAFLAKYDAEGNYLWAIKLADSINYGSSSSVTGMVNLTVDSFGNVYLSGSVYGNGDLDSGPNENLIVSSSTSGISIFAKYNGEGQYLWARSLSGAGGTVARIYKIGLDNASHIYFSGNFNNTVDFDPGPDVAELTSVTGGAASNVFLASYDTGGNYQWVRSLGSMANWATAFDEAANIYISGWFKGTMDFDPGPGEANLTSTEPNLSTMYIAKYDSGGNYLKAIKLDGTRINSSQSQLLTNNLGGLYFYGSFSDTVDCDPGPGEALFFSGGTTVRNMLLAKYDTGLNYEWALVAESYVGGLVLPGRFSLDGRTDNVYVCGRFTRTIDFDPGPGVAELTPTGNSQNPDGYIGFLASYDACGHYLWAGSMGSTGGATNSINISGLTIGENSLYLSGVFSDTIDVNPLLDSVGLMPAGSSDGFLLKMNISRDTLTATGCHGSFSFNDKTYTASGIYFDTLTSSLGCDSIATLSLTIIPNPQLTLDNGTLTASNADSYQWLSCDANMIVPGASSQTYTPVISGSYAVITTTSGCTDTSECIQVEVTGVDELSPGNKVLLYPNPTHDMVQILATQSLQGMDVRVVNAVGQTMALYPNIAGKVYSLDMSAYASGMYYVEISKDGKALLRKKVTKL